MLHPSPASYLKGTVVSVLEKFSTGSQASLPILAITLKCVGGGGNDILLKCDCVLLFAHTLQSKDLSYTLIKNKIIK